MPQLHLSRRTGRRLLATGAIAAVAVLGTPAVASAETDPLGDIQQQIDDGAGDLAGVLQGSESGSGDSSGGEPSELPSGLPSGQDPQESISAGAACVNGLVEGVTVSIGDIVGGLAGLGSVLGDLLGQENPIAMQQTSATTATGTLPLTLDDLVALIGADRLQELIDSGQDQVTVPIELVVGGVTNLVDVVFKFVDCLAALIPTPEAAPPSTQPAPETAPDTQPAAPVTTQPAAPAQAVAYPGYAPTGGAPSDDSSPAGLIGLGALVAASGGGALWLRARRGVAG